MSIARVPITLAISEYDHVEDLVSGRIPVEGVELTPLRMSVEEIFQRFSRAREWEASEFSFAQFVHLRSRGDDSLVGIPVFPSRVFRHSAIFVRAGGRIAAPEDLAGARVGVPEWAQTAGVYARGVLADEYGVDLRSIDWVQAGTNEPGRTDAVAVELPDGFRYERRPDSSLDAMLLSGEVDAVVTAHPPRSFERRDSPIVRLIKDHAAVERRSWERTGIFPIMHVIVLRRDVHDAHPWVAANLLRAFEAAKAAGVRRLRELTASRVALPWASEQLDALAPLFGDDWWPYGVEANRTTLEAFMGWSVDQGVAAAAVPVEQLFAPQTLIRSRV
ncbi:hypothetical protein [Conexibacter sp. CPCC 206217]|uniref:hypothetical protein n=1 Tax=Conexibacter sp. CPCC 206217 TaxID=3064574 RepID=UPI00271CDAAE|nr:hypothetical protein [Conexibacter sp. CPCC 206217]MDO8212073.1 hypothetical protein [Conexibacter sp. CPCC 206217]